MLLWQSLKLKIIEILLRTYEKIRVFQLEGATIFGLPCALSDKGDNRKTIATSKWNNGYSLIGGHPRLDWFSHHYGGRRRSVIVLLSERVTF